MRGSYLHLISNTALHITFLSYLSHCSEKWFQSLYRGFGFVLPHNWVYLSPDGVVLNPEGFVLSPEGDVLNPEGFTLPHFWDYLPPEEVVLLSDGN